MADRENMMLSIGFVVLIFIAMLSLFVTDLGNTSSLNQESIDYASKFQASVNDSSINAIANEEVDSDVANPLGDEGEESFLEDILGAVKFFVGKTTAVWDFVKVLYNFPSFFVETLFGEWTGKFKPVINILGLIVGVYIVIMLVRLVR